MEKEKKHFWWICEMQFWFWKILFEGWEGFHVPNTTKISYLKSAFGIKLSLISTLVVNPQSLGNALANFNVESQKWFCRWNKLLKIRTSILLVPSLSSSLISLKTKQLFKQGYLDDNSFQILVMLYIVDRQIRNCLKLSNSWAVSCLFEELICHIWQDD